MCRSLKHTWLAIGLVLSGGCGPSEEQRNVEAQSPEAAASVHWMFEPTEAERATVNGYLDQLRRRLDAELRGEMYRFLPDDRSGRYVLVTLLPVESGSAEIGFIAMGSEVQGTISPPFRTSIRESIQSDFTVAAVQDLDGDQLLDLAYCRWTGDQDVGETLAVGYTREWYAIEVEPHSACEGG